MRSALLVLALVACSGEPRRPSDLAPGDYSFAGDWLEWRLDGAMSDLGVPGAAIALIDDQDIVYRRDVGRLEVDRPAKVDQDTVWRVGSVSKLLTAIAVLQQVEAGTLDLDAPITDWIPDASFPGRFDDAEPITARHLLAHRAGIPRNSGLPLWYWEVADDPAQAFFLQTEALATQPVAWPPGERYHYSNAGYQVLAHLTEATTDRLWFDVMLDDVFRPIGMHDSAVVSDALADGAPLAVGHFDDDGEVVAGHQYDIITMASGNLYTTVDDLAAFVSWVFRDGDPALDGALLWESFEPQYARPRDPEEHGLGWETSSRVFDEPVVFHTGTNQGTRTMVALLPESRLGVVVVGNHDAFAQPANEIAVEALALMRDASGDPVPERSDPARIDLEHETLDACTGVWIVGGDAVEVWRKGGKLKAHYEGFDLALHPVGRSRFDVDHWLGDPGDIEVAFRLGDPDLMIVDLMGMEYQLGVRYDVDSLAPRWHDLAGRYRQRPAMVSEHWDPDDSWPVDLTLTDEGVLTLPGMPLWPVSDTELRVVGGEFDGETVAWDPGTRELTHGGYVWAYRRPLDEGCGCRSTPLPAEWWRVLARR